MVFGASCCHIPAEILVEVTKHKTFLKEGSKKEPMAHNQFIKHTSLMLKLLNELMLIHEQVRYLASK